jgi:histidinol dehydrogenase
VRVVRELKRPADMQPTHRERVREIVRDMRRHDLEALLRYTALFDRVELKEGELEVPRDEWEKALAALDPEVRAGLERAIANIRAVAEAQLREPLAIDLPEGQRIEVVEVPIARVGVYAPGGRAAYPSSVAMCAVTARAAGVSQIVACTPPGRDGQATPVVLAACALCDVDEVYRVGGAQAIGAMAYGCGPVPEVDMVVGPGNRYVAEAKRQVSGDVGIDSLAGPSELIVIASEGADPELVALDLLAQGEHGPESFVAVLSPDPGFLGAVEAEIGRLAPQRPSVVAGEVGVISVPDVETALWIVEHEAPEHLELVGADAEALADRVRNAGCVFVGSGAGTAFGDYVAGSNHVLPTGYAARFQSALSVATFRRRMARVSLPGEAPARLAPAGAALARAEGFPVHAESMERRA